MKNIKGNWRETIVFAIIKYIYMVVELCAQNVCGVEPAWVRYEETAWESNNNMNYKVKGVKIHLCNTHSQPTHVFFFNVVCLVSVLGRVLVSFVTVVTEVSTNISKLFNKIFARLPFSLWRLFTLRDVTGFEGLFPYFLLSGWDFVKRICYCYTIINSTRSEGKWEFLMFLIVIWRRSTPICVQCTNKLCKVNRNRDWKPYFHQLYSQIDK